MSEPSAARKAALWVGAVFLLGAALGGLLGFIFARHSVSASSSLVNEPEPVRRARRVEQLTRELSLADAQRQQLDAILMDWHAETKTINDQHDAQIGEIRRKGRNEVRAILTPEQQPKFEEFLKRLDEERKRNGPPPRP
jgi:Spy/CpxP family protein refolding chaperone